MRKIDNRDQLLSKIFEIHPEIETTRVITAKQFFEIFPDQKYLPSWLYRNRVGRGLHSIDPSNITGVKRVVKEKPVPIVRTETPENSETVVQQIFDISTPRAAMVPTKDKTFVPFGNFDDLERIIVSGMFYPAYVVGPTGNGKSTMIEQICAKHKLPLIRVNLNMMSDEDQLIGSKTLHEGNIEIVEGPVLIAMRTGSTILLDEIDAGSANTLLCLQPILEGKPYYFKLKNEVIVPAPGFNIIATANTKGKGSDDGRYIGTNVLNEAFLERFAVTFEQEYPSARTELKIVTNLMNSFDCLNEKFASNLVKWAESVRRTFDDGGVDETITTRRISHIIRAYSIFKSETKSIELCCNRFDVNTKTAFIDLYTKIADEPEVEEASAEEKLNYTEEIPF